MRGGIAPNPFMSLLWSRHRDLASVWFFFLFAS
jgi:hypothetical protein